MHIMYSILLQDMILILVAWWLESDRWQTPSVALAVPDAKGFADLYFFFCAVLGYMEPPAFFFCIFVFFCAFMLLQW